MASSMSTTNTTIVRHEQVNRVRLVTVQVSLAYDLLLEEEQTLSVLVEEGLGSELLPKLTDILS